MDPNNQYHYNVDTVQRAKGESLVQTLSYNERADYRDPRTGTLFSYSDEAEDVIAKGVVGIKGSTLDAVVAIEKAEKRKDAVVARKINASIPYQLRDRAGAMTRDYFTRVNTRYGVPCFFSVQKPPRRKKRGKSVAGDARNYHMHGGFGMRPCDANGVFAAKRCTAFEAKFGQKDHEDGLLELRKMWADICNEYLERAGYQDVRWSHLSHEARGIEDEPQAHMGQAATYTERTGETTERGERNRKTRKRNADRKAQKAAPVAAKASPATQEKAPKNSAAVAAHPPVTSPAPMTPPVSEKTPLPNVHTAAAVPAPAAAKTPSAKSNKLTPADREYIAKRFESPTFSDGFAGRHRGRVDRRSHAARENTRAAQSRRSRNDEMEDTRREIDRIEQTIAITADRSTATARRAGTARAERTRTRAEIARIRAEKLAAKKAAKKPALARNPRLQAAAKIGEKKIAESIQELTGTGERQGPTVTTVDLSKLDNLGSLLDHGTPSRGAKSR